MNENFRHNMATASLNTGLARRELLQIAGMRQEGSEGMSLREVAELASDLKGSSPCHSPNDKGNRKGPKTNTAF